MRGHRRGGGRGHGEITVQGPTVITQTIDGQEYSWTFAEGGIASGTFLDREASLGIYAPYGATLTAVSPTPTVADVDDWDGTPLTNQHINGAFINPGQTMSNDRNASEEHPLDERMPGYNAAYALSLPVSLVPGDRVLLCKSRTTPIQKASEYGSVFLHSMAGLTVMDSLPADATYLRPPLNGLGTGSLDLVAPVDESTIPLIAAPATPLDMTGEGVTLDWDGTFTDASYDLSKWCTGLEMSFRGMDLGTVECMVTEQFNDSAGTTPGYSWPNGFARRLLRLRVDSGLSSAERQEIVNDLMQLGVGLHGFLAERAAVGADGYCMYPESGGHVAVFQPMLPILAAMFYDAGATGIAASLYAAATSYPTASFRGNSLTLRSLLQLTTQIKYTNTTDCTVFRAAYTIDSATDTTITFSSSVDWGALIYAEPFLSGGLGYTRLTWYFEGAPFVVSSGPEADADIIYAIASFAGTRDGWDGTGGTFDLIESFSSNGKDYTNLAGETVTFIVADPRLITNVTYNDSNEGGAHYLEDLDPADVPEWSAMTPGYIYFGLAVGRSVGVWLAGVGWTHTLWGGTELQTTVEVYKRIKDVLEYRRQLGDTPYDRFLDEGNVLMTPSIETYVREYMHSGSGEVGSAYVLPVSP